jgi:hypothetical protein
VRELTSGERVEVEELRGLDENSLYALLALHDPESQGTYFRTEGQIDAGRRAYQKIEAIVRAKICQEWKACERLSGALAENETDLIVAIGDVLSVFVFPFPPFTISALVVKIGVRKICKCLG